MLKRRRLVKQEPENLDELYFKEIRPKLYELHAAHKQHGSRKGRTLAEHLDSACQFVLTVSKIAGVPEEKRACILAATAVHDLNKLIEGGGSVKALARDRELLKGQLDRACVDTLVKTEADLELVRRLIESHSGHGNSDGMRFVAEDPQVKEQIKRWSAMLIGGDLFDLGIEEAKRIGKVENELTVAFGRSSQLFKVTLSEDRGYLTSLLLSACEEVLHQHGLHTLAIDPDGQIFEGEAFPAEDLTVEIAKEWKKKIDAVFKSNIDELVTDKSTNGIKVDPQAIEQDPATALETVERLLVKKYLSYKGTKVRNVEESIKKYTDKALSEFGKDLIFHAEKLGLVAISTAEEFSIAEGLKAALVSYRQVKPEISPKVSWQKICKHMGLSHEQTVALEIFEEQYGRCLFAVKASREGMKGVEASLRESFELRGGIFGDVQVEVEKVSERFVNAVKCFLNLPALQKQNFFEELSNYIEARPNQRSSLGSIRSDVSQLKQPQMPPETKVQMFSNRLRGGASGDPVRCADFISALAYKLIKVGANFPSSIKQTPTYLHLALPKGSSPAFLAHWQQRIEEAISSDSSVGLMIPNQEQLREEGKLIFKSSKGVGIALPRRPEFIYSTTVSAVTWGEANSSVTLLRSLHLALKISLNEEVELPFVLSSNLEIENQWSNYFGRVEGIPSSLIPLLGFGAYRRRGHIDPKSEIKFLLAEDVYNRLDCIEKLSESIASAKKRDDCFYDLARAARSPFEIYYVLLRWILREKDESSLDSTLDEIYPYLSNLVESLMSEKDKVVSQYLREAAQIACEGKLWGNLRRRTGRAEPFSAFLKAIRSFKSPLDWETVFPSLINQYHTRLDRIRDGVGDTKYEYVSRYYNILYELFSKEYQSRPEKILSNGKDLEAAYLHFLREEYKKMNPPTDGKQEK
ncbi:MAG: hypothetical protein RBJ76_00930 [Stenomitos frigidus ULC029]